MPTILNKVVITICRNKWRHVNVCFQSGMYIRGLPLITYEPRGDGGGSSLPYISIAYYMQKGVEGVQIACKIAYVISGRPLI